MIFMLIAMIAIFYFLMIRPENKKKKKTEEMLAMRFAVMHNLFFYNSLARTIRDELDAGTFGSFRSKYSEILDKRI